jgi:hypothetical protein
VPLVLLAACQQESALVSRDATTWRGKTIAWATLPHGALNVETVGGDVVTGISGSGEGFHLEDPIMVQNRIENPGTPIARSLFEQAQQRYGLLATSPEPLAGSPDRQYGTVTQADLVITVFSATAIGFHLGAGLASVYTFGAVKPKHYFAKTWFTATLIDVGSGKIIREHQCTRSSRTEPDAPTLEELLEDQAARLKALLAGQSDDCLKELQERFFSRVR